MHTVEELTACLTYNSLQMQNLSVDEGSTLLHKPQTSPKYFIALALLSFGSAVIAATALG